MLQLCTYTRQPLPPHARAQAAYAEFDSEAIMVLTMPWQSGCVPGLYENQHRPDNGGEHICFYYAGRIGSNVVGAELLTTPFAQKLTCDRSTPMAARPS
jgi:hypothetical protein